MTTFSLASTLHIRDSQSIPEPIVPRAYQAAHLGHLHFSDPPLTASVSGTAVSVVRDARIRESASISVWRGVLTDANGQPIRVVGKEAYDFARLRRLANEVKIYGLLKKFQGDHIPTLLGMYTQDPDVLPDSRSAPIHAVVLWIDMGMAFETWQDIRQMSKDFRIRGPPCR
ncbi:unnamed protein product [Peniophora sp. CBMAI 1063]|nr:unnamed protein product [Peniophora sp. CBMAI 1063]